jgi:ribonuclease P protein component
MQRIKRRQDFVAAAKAAAQGTPGFFLVAHFRGDDGAPRVGFTCTKKLGNAVARNRIRRRLKEAVRLSFDKVAMPSYDYILIGRSAAQTRGFEILQSDLISAATRLHAKASAKPTEAK